MFYALACEERPAYLHARVSGERTRQNFLRYLDEAFCACLAAGRASVLLEMHFSGPQLSSLSVLEVISRTLPDALKLAKVAYVDAGQGDLAMAAFAETVALNRGVNARLFDSVAEASRWLSNA
jgi:hypothetical protein